MNWMRMQASYDLPKERRKRAGATRLIAMQDSKRPPIDWAAFLPAAGASRPDPPVIRPEPEAWGAAGAGATYMPPSQPIHTITM